MALCEKGGQIFFDSQLVSHIARGENDKVEPILAEISNPRELRNSAGKTLLHIAARYGNAAMTKRFLELGFDVDARDKFHVTPLVLAVQYLHLDVIAILLDARADIYDSAHRECPLRSVHAGYMSRREPRQSYDRAMRLFSNRVCADSRADRLATGTRLRNANCSLHLVAMVLRSPKLTRHYLKSGFDVDAPEPHSRCTALHAAVGGTDLPVVKVLLENGADVNALDRFKRTPICYYDCHSRESNVKLEMLEYLLDRGASLALADVADCTPLEYLLTRAKARTVSALLRRDADLAATRFRLGRTPLHFLANNITPDVMAGLQGMTYEVDAREESGKTPLMIAVLKNKNFSSVEFLLDNGADVNADNNGQTPLSCAVDCSFRKVKLPKVTADICKLLLQRGANVQHVFKTYKNKKVIDDRTTLFDLLAKNEQFEVSKWLLAQLALNNVHGETIADIVREKIESHEVLNEQFDVCRRQIEQMKEARINESLTLFELMTGKEEDLVTHAIDFEFVSKLDELMNDILRENTYYADVAKTRLASVVQTLKLTKEFEAVITQPTCCIS